MSELNVALPADLSALIEDAVASGDYLNRSEVISEALREWQARRSLRQEEHATLQKLWHEGIASGPGQLRSMDAIKAEARRRFGLHQPERG